MQILRYELKKILDGKTVFILMALLLLNLLLFYNQSYRAQTPAPVRQRTAELEETFRREASTQNAAVGSFNDRVLALAQQMQNDLLLVGSWLENGYVDLPQEQLEELITQYTILFERYLPHGCFHAAHHMPSMYAPF